MADAGVVLASISEKQFQAQVVELAQLFGWLVYHTYDSRRSAHGFPDLVLVRGERVLFVELKRQDGKATPKQRVWLEALKAAGQEVYLWRPSDWDALEAVLR